MEIIKDDGVKLLKKFTLKKEYPFDNGYVKGSYLITSIKKTPSQWFEFEYFVNVEVVNCEYFTLGNYWYKPDPKTFKKNKIKVNQVLKPTIGGYIGTQFKLFSEDYRVTVLSVKWK